MGSTIKGITVQIGGDTVNLNKTLKGVDTTSKNLQRELNLVNKELKFNPDNAVLLAQKQEILTDKINATREKLQKLNEVQEQVERQAKSGDLGADEYRAYQREVESTKSKLEHLESELGKTNDKFSEVQRKANEVNFNNAEGKVKSFKDKFKDMADKSIESAEQLKKKLDTVGDGLEKAGGVISKGSAAGAAVLAGSVAAFKDLDNGYDAITKKTGATNEKFDSLKKTADELFSGSTFDMTAIGNAVGEINTRFGFTDERLKSVTKSYLQFAEINDADVSDSVAKTARIMQAWNVSSENIPDLLGMITAKSQETGVSADALMNKVLDNNSVFKEMDLSLEESISLMAQFERNGVNDSTALMALKTAVKNSAKEGEGLSDVLRKNVADIKNAKTDTEALQIATSLFGTRGAAEMANAIKEGRINFDDLSGSMSNYKSTVKDTYEGTLDPIDESKKMINNLKLAGAELASVAMKEGEPLIEDVIDGVKGVTEWLKKLTPEQKKTLAKTIEIVAVAGPAVTLAGKAAKGIGGIVTAATKLVPKLISATAAQGGLNAAMDANPVGAVVLGVTALIAVLGGLKAAIDDAQNKQLAELGFTEQAEKLQESVDKVKNLKDEVNNLNEGLNSSLKDSMSDLGVIDTYKSRLDELLEKANLSDAEQAELVTIGDYFSEKYPDFKNTWDHYKEVDSEGKEKLKDNVKSIKGELDALIDKYKKVAASQALSNLSISATEAYVKATQNTNDAAIEYMEAQKNLSNFKDKYSLDDEFLDLLKKSTANNGADANFYAAGLYAKYKEAGIDPKDISAKNLYSQYTKLKDSVDDLGESYKEIVNQTAELRESGEQYNQMQAVLKGNYDDASAVIMAYYNNLINTSDIENSKWGSLDNLRKKAQETVDDTSKSDALIKQITDESTDYAKFKLGIIEENTNTAVKKASGKMNELPIIFSGTMTNSAQAVKEHRTELNSAMSNSAELGVKAFAIKVDEGQSEVEKSGRNFILGFVKGLLDKTGLSRIWSAAQNIGNFAINGLKEILDIHSPSGVAEDISNNYGDTFANNLLKKRKAAKYAGMELGKSANLGLNSVDFGAYSKSLHNTYASLNKLKSSGIAQKSASVNNINNSSSKSINGGINVTINNAKLDTDADMERFSEQLADIIIRKGMEWG